jgi:peptidyl-dipeptidase A
MGVVLTLVPRISGGRVGDPTVADAEAFMKNAEAELLLLVVAGNRTEWVAETYITGDTEILTAAAQEQVIKRTTELVNEGKRFEKLDLPPELRRKFLLLKLSLGLPAPNDAKLRGELTQISSSLGADYGKGKYCPGGTKEKCFGIDDLEEQFAKERDAKKLSEIWTGWHKVGAPMHDRYARFAELSNQGARELGFVDTGALWRSGYDMTPEQFSAEMERLWKQVEPLYTDLHAYVRRKLIEKYGPEARRSGGLIPAHLLGNMWAQDWSNIYDLVGPSSAEGNYDLGNILQSRHKNAKEIVQYGEGFFRSLGFALLPETFWQRSQFVRPADRDVVCHASAWDIDTQDDLRIKVCLHGTSEDFVTVHHELGHVFYSRSYKIQPLLFRNGANDGFHEAIGDAIALSITPAYLKEIGLLEQETPAQTDVPQLLRKALEKIAFLPFGLLIDKWRWEVFSGKVQPAEYNRAWWQLREQFQGVAPPVDRSERDFDPGAKYHIPANTPYARYFLAAVYQFQFYRAMCRAAGYTGPLNRCSFYGSQAAGDKLQAMMALGASKPWPEALKAMTGEDHADASAIMEYFQPLSDWLKEQNKGEKTGWTASNDPLRAG